MPGYDKKLLVVGCGNAYTGDDAVGFRLVRTLAQSHKASPSLRFVAMGRPGLEVLDTFEREDHVLFLDAVTSGREPGTLIIAPHPIDGVTQRSSINEDGWGISEVFALARSTGRRVPPVSLIGVEVGSGYAARDAVRRAEAYVAGNFDELRTLVTSRRLVVLEPQREFAHA